MPNDGGPPDSRGKGCARRGALGRRRCRASTSHHRRAAHAANYITGAPPPLPTMLAWRRRPADLRLWPCSTRGRVCWGEVRTCPSWPCVFQPLCRAATITTSRRLMQRGNARFCRTAAMDAKWEKSSAGSRSISFSPMPQGFCLFPPRFGVSIFYLLKQNVIAVRGWGQ